MSDHTLTVHFDDGETEYLTLECNLEGPERPCAVIDCPVDHEDVSRACIDTHGAVARDECWAVEFYEAGGRETVNTEALSPASVPVRVIFDDGIVVEDDNPVVEWIAADLQSGEMFEVTTTVRISPGCFVPEGQPHVCDGCGCECHG